MSSATYRQRASSYEDEERYGTNRYSLHGSAAANGGSTNLYSAQDLHRFAQNADRFTTNVRREIFFIRQIIVVYELLAETESPIYFFFCAS